MRHSRPWRVVATAVCFSVFGLGGLVYGLLVFPLLRLVDRNPQRRQHRARALIAASFRAFVELMRISGVLRYELHGLERLQRDGLLILANHPTLIDVVFLVGHIRQSNCIVKAALLRNPVMRGPVLATGYLFNDSPSGLIEDCVRSLQAGNNLLIFPEGTRTGADGVLRLRRGAAQIAVRGRRDITPVSIRCVPPSLGKGGRWYRVPVRPMHFRIEVHEDIRLGPILADGAPEPLAARRLNAELARYFTDAGNKTAHADA